ncbi:hypothetical protein FEM48_Zijuj12G0016400 [Ziziphus jujuba var. spinosa]|uniref:Haloacid dehalogenase-like hydrolase domain-containing protein 3 n=1 Tax=Ziziphus jujuba var. spinosa TaxID=714518 RepID=A0A978UAG2_ZIZJJ|nr:hypothetical protein FEM48_Zijuj12G0016400 [Ziziphus jujuba var. spinosa]
MALMASSRTKLSRLLTIFTEKAQNLKSGSCFNGVSGSFGANPNAGLQGALFYSSSALASKESEVIGSRRMGWEILGVKDYEDYRRSLYGEITHKALLVDAVGTLLVPSQPMAQIYRQIGEKYGVVYSEAEILNRYRRAYEQPWGRSRLR